MFLFWFHKYLLKIIIDATKASRDRNYEYYFIIHSFKYYLYSLGLRVWGREKCWFKWGRAEFSIHNIFGLVSGIVIENLVKIRIHKYWIRHAVIFHQRHQLSQLHQLVVLDEFINYDGPLYFFVVSRNFLHINLFSCNLYKSSIVR